MMDKDTLSGEILRLLHDGKERVTAEIYEHFGAENKQDQNLISNRLQQMWLNRQIWRDVKLNKAIWKKL